MTTSLRTLGRRAAARATIVAAATVAVAGWTVGLTTPDHVAFPIAPSDVSSAPAWEAYPACENEDGPGPCVWDAAVEGNGAGSSFFIAEDFCTYRFDGSRDESFPCVNEYAE